MIIKQRTTIYVPVDLWKEFSVLCKSQNKSCSNTIVGMIEEFCAKTKTIQHSVITNSPLGIRDVAEITTVTAVSFSDFSLAEPVIMRRETPSKSPVDTFNIPEEEVINQVKTKSSNDPFALP